MAAVGVPIVAADAGRTVVTVTGASGAGGVVAVNVAVVAVSAGAAGVGASVVGLASGRGEAGNVVTGEGDSSTLQAMSVRADAKATRIKMSVANDRLFMVQPPKLDGSPDSPVLL